MCQCEKSTAADKTLLVLAIITIVISSITFFYSFAFTIVIAAFCSFRESTGAGFGCSGIGLGLTVLSGAMLCAGILECTAGAGVCCCAPYTKSTRKCCLIVASCFRVITLGLGIWLIVFCISATVTPAWSYYDPAPPGSEGTTLCYFNACMEDGEMDDQCCGPTARTGCAEGYAFSKVRDKCCATSWSCRSPPHLAPLPSPPRPALPSPCSAATPSALSSQQVQHDFQYATWVNAPEGFPSLPAESRCTAAEGNT